MSGILYACAALPLLVGSCANLRSFKANRRNADFQQTVTGLDPGP